jgi:hypothetical protein
MIHVLCVSIYSKWQDFYHHLLVTQKNTYRVIWASVNVQSVYRLLFQSLYTYRCVPPAVWTLTNMPIFTIRCFVKLPIYQCFPSAVCKLTNITMWTNCCLIVSLETSRRLPLAVCNLHHHNVNHPMIVRLLTSCFLSGVSAIIPDAVSYMCCLFANWVLKPDKMTLDKQLPARLVCLGHRRTGHNTVEDHLYPMSRKTVFIMRTKRLKIKKQYCIVYYARRYHLHWDCVFKHSFKNNHVENKLLTTLKPGQSPFKFNRLIRNIYKPV